MRKIFCLFITIAFFSLALTLITSCGQKQSGGGSSTDYQLSGKITGVTTLGMHKAAIDTVTDIVAVGANNEKYLATLGSDGSFTIPISKGWPYVIGFYNKSGGKITLLGYLKQKDVNWESLPVMEPTGSTTDLGSIEVNAVSLEAVPSLALNSLISQMNMSLSTAQYYGELDDNLIVLTNLDVNNNGEFDFAENKHYLYQVYIGMDQSSGAGQISKMLNGNYNDTYLPVPAFYTLIFTAKGDDQPAGATATFHFPVDVSDGQNTTRTVSTTLDAITGTGAVTWFCASKISKNPLTSPALAPPGTHEVTIGSTKYTFHNFKSSEIVKINSNNGLIYPVFSLVTNGAGYITTVNYKWKKLVNGTITDANAGEVKAAVQKSISTSSSAFVHPSPFISFYNNSGPPGDLSLLSVFERDGSSLDISAANLKLSDVNQIQASINLTSQVVVKFDLF